MTLILNLQPIQMQLNFILIIGNNTIRKLKTTLSYHGYIKIDNVLHLLFNDFN